MKEATFGAGCFWNVEAAFRQIQGVLETTVGYSGGDYDNPSYKDVCTGKTGHAEVVRVVYDPDRVSYDHLLEMEPSQISLWLRPTAETQERA